MRGLFWVLLLAALAVAITLGARYNAGYVLLVLHPYRVELSLNLLIALLLVGFAAAYVLARVVVHTLRLPNEVRRFREERRMRRAQQCLLRAVRAFLEGRYAQAEKAAAESIELREHAGIAAVIAARAAHELRAYERQDRYLALASNFGPDDEVMRAIAQAELALHARQHQIALAALERLPRKHTAALRLELRAVQLARQWERYLELLPMLEKAQALDETQAGELRRHAVVEVLARKSQDLNELSEYWRRLGPREQLDSKIAADAARAFIAHGEYEEAQRIIEASLAHEWDSGLVELYGDCPGESALSRIEHAESWLKEHSSDAGLLLALGTLCARQRLWGKARSYIEASLSIEESFKGTMALARLLEAMGEADAARRYYRRSLELAESLLTGAQRAPALPAPRTAPTMSLTQV